MRRTLFTIALASFAAVLAISSGAPLRASQKWQDEPSYIKGLIPGWTGLVDPMGHCRFSVPADWDVHDAERLALARDGAATAEEEWAASVHWTRYKSHISGVLKPTVLHEDSKQRLWFEYDAGWSGVHHYVAVPAANSACVLRIDVRVPVTNALAGVIRQIAGSLVSLP